MKPNSRNIVEGFQHRYIRAVNNELNDILVDSTPVGVRNGGEVRSLLRYHLGWEEANGTPANKNQGKSLRSALCLLACEITRGRWKSAIPAAASLELIHNFSLIHDDVQDKDTTRRGRSTVWSIWGIPKAIIAGNAMRVLADQSLSNLSLHGLNPELTLKAVSMLTERYTEMIEGQYLDMSFEQFNSISIENYLEMIERKTGALIQSAMFIGALIGSRNQGVAEAFGACGNLLGLAFQIRDDYLGIWGDPNIIGKPVGSDILRKKKSLPVIHAFQEAKGNSLVRLKQIYSSDQISATDLTDVLDIMRKLDSSSFVDNMAQSYASAAIEKLTGLELPSGAKSQIESVSHFFINRDH